MSEFTLTKGEVIERIIRGADSELTYKDVQDEFKELTGLTVSIGRVKQVALAMRDRGEVNIRYRVNEQGNAIGLLSSPK